MKKMKFKAMKRLIGAVCALSLCASQLTGCGAPRTGGNGTGDMAGNSTQATVGSQTGGKQGEVSSEGAGVSQTQGAAMGRYAENKVDLQGIDHLSGMSSDGGRIRVFSDIGQDMVSEDGGPAFTLDASTPKAFLDRASGYLSGLAVSPSGQRLYTSFSELDEDAGEYEYITYLMQPDGTEKELTELSRDTPTALSYGENGYFYAYAGKNIYQIDPAAGETVFLYEAGQLPGYMNAVGKRLFVALEGELQIFDLETGKLAEPDRVLSDFLNPYLTSLNFQGSFPVLISQGKEEDSLYVLVRDGLYQHVMNGSVMEQVIDGALCSIGDVSKNFRGMSVIKGEGADIVYILFYDGTLLRYVYDETLPTVPDTILRIYSVYEDENVRLAVGAFQAEHPELYAKYEVGVPEESGQTKEDALKALSTELAAGKGPDVLVMDDIPYDSYVEKGVLAELDGTAASVGGMGLMENMLDAFRRDGKLYTIPAVYSVPLLCGSKEAISGADSLEKLADRLEEARAQRPEGSLINFGSAGDALSLFALASGSAWVKEDGSMDREAVTDFLTQCKRIYEAQICGINEDQKESYMRSGLGTTDHKSGNMHISSGTNIVLALNMADYFKQSYAAGVMSGKAVDMAMLQSNLKLSGMEYMLMPGQGGKVFLSETMLSINSAGAYREQAEAFVKFALSADFQGGASLSGAPINRDAFQARQAFPDPDKSPDEPYMYLVSSDESGKLTNLDVYWATEEEFARFGALADSLIRPAMGNTVVTEAVIELGKEALTGEKEIEETVEAIEKRVQLYLAE